MNTKTLFLIICFLITFHLSEAVKKTSFLTDESACWQNIYIRRSSSVQCRVGLELVGSQCYSACNSDYSPYGSSCLQRCPEGFPDYVTYCQRYSLYTACPAGFSANGLSCYKPSYQRTAVESGTCAAGL